jgi:Ca2+-binding EF-hand superfamily protein
MDRPERLIRAFQAFDGERNGRVSTQAMITVLSMLGNKLTPDEIKEFIADADDNGTIDYRRYVNTVIFGST